MLQHISNHLDGLLYSSEKVKVYYTSVKAMETVQRSPLMSFAFFPLVLYIQIQDTQILLFEHRNWTNEEQMTYVRPLAPAFLIIRSHFFSL